MLLLGCIDVAEPGAPTDQGEVLHHVAQIACGRKSRSGHPMSGVALAVALALASITFGGVLVWLRHRAYRRRISYNPRQDCVLGMAGPAIETISVRCEEGGFV